MERIRKEAASRASANAAHITQAKSAQSSAASRFNDSPNMLAQRKKLQSLFGGTAQLQGAEDEMLQGRFDAVQRMEEDESLQGKFAAVAPAQFKEAPTPKPNNTGLPDQLKSGVESLSGMSMDHVKVHYNSPQPAQLNALAYAQGSDIHVASGQEQHLPHEAWHVVQQAQGRVQPTMQMKDGVPVNDDKGLEQEADVMGARAVQLAQQDKTAGPSVFQAMSSTIRGRQFRNSRNADIVQMASLAIGKAFNNTPANRDAGKLGLGEVLTLTSAANGPDKVGEGAGAAEYAKESGTGTLVGSSYTANGGAGNVEFSVKRDDEDDALKDKLTVEVVAPQGASFVTTSSNNTAFANNIAGAGFDGKKTVYTPTTVSFNGLSFREGSAPLASTGSYAGGNGDMHAIGQPMAVNEKNIENSTDTINSDPIDETAFSNGGAGEARWPIPWEYTIDGADDWHAFMTATHLEEIGADATVTMSKLNGSETRTPSAGTWTPP